MKSLTQSALQGQADPRPVLQSTSAFLNLETLHVIGEQQVQKLPKYWNEGLVGFPARRCPENEVTVFRSHDSHAEKLEIGE